MDAETKKKLKGKIALMIGIGPSKKGGDDDDDPEETGDEEGSDLDDAAQELIDAIKSGDAESVSDALCAHYAAYENGKNDAE